MSEHAKDILAEVFIGIFAWLVLGAIFIGSFKDWIKMTLFILACAILASPFIWAMARLG